MLRGCIIAINGNYLCCIHMVLWKWKLGWLTNGFLSWNWMVTLWVSFSYPHHRTCCRSYIWWQEWLNSCSCLNNLTKSESWDQLGFRDPPLLFFPICLLLFRLSSECWSLPALVLGLILGSLHWMTDGCPYPPFSNSKIDLFDCATWTQICHVTWTRYVAWPQHTLIASCKVHLNPGFPFHFPSHFPLQFGITWVVGNKVVRPWL